MPPLSGTLDRIVRGPCGTPGCTDPGCSIPYGRCHCGCGEETRPPTTTSVARNLVQGEPQLYVHGHGGKDARWSNPVGWVCARDGGDRLKQAREAKGLSQRALAQGADVGGHSISDLEGVAGYKTKVEKAERIAAVLEMPLEELFTAEFPRVRQDRRVRTRPGSRPGSAARASVVDLERYCREHDLWTGSAAADFLGMDPKMVSYLSRKGLLPIAEEYHGHPFTAVLYRPADVKQFARERRRATDHRIQRDPMTVLERAIARGCTLERAKLLAERCRSRNERHAKIRAGLNWAAPLHARWRRVLDELQSEFPDVEPNVLLADVALRDWQDHPEDWPRERYPANPNDQLDFADGRVRESARDRVRKALQIARKNC
jgi:transcriptional regulator with XRE-family HTH domain